MYCTRKKEYNYDKLIRTYLAYYTVLTVRDRMYVIVEDSRRKKKKKKKFVSAPYSFIVLQKKNKKIVHLQYFLQQRAPNLIYYCATIV